VAGFFFEGSSAGITPPLGGHSARLRNNRSRSAVIRSMKKISTPPLLKMRTIVSEDGRWARFFLLFTTGQNTAFSIPFNKIGLLLKAVKTVIKTMADRIAARGAFSTEEVAEGLAEPITVKAIESGRDADTGDKLLWIETTDSGVFAFRLSGPAKEALADALHEDEPGDELFGRPAEST
jgi:hypothetical protein